MKFIFADDENKNLFKYQKHVYVLFIENAFLTEKQISLTTLTEDKIIIDTRKLLIIRTYSLRSTEIT